jgi:RNA polymerase sigma-70 factor (ECF subfamily)
VVRADATHDSQSPSAKRFRVLAERELPRLYGLARRLVGDEAEDVVQDCLLRAYRSFAQLEREQASRQWLTNILVNCCRDLWRQRGRRVEQVELAEVDEFSLFRKIADVDPFPYSEFAEELRGFLASHAQDELPPDIHARLTATLDELGRR